MQAFSWFKPNLLEILKSGFPSSHQLGILVISSITGDFWQPDEHLRSMSGAFACGEIVKINR